MNAYFDPRLLFADLFLPVIFCAADPASDAPLADNGFWLWPHQGSWRARPRGGNIFSPVQLCLDAPPEQVAAAWASAHPALLFDDQAQPLGLINLPDFTARTLSVANRYSAMIDAVLANVDEMICGIDENGVVNLFNQRAEEFYKIKREDILGQQITDFFSDLVITQVQYNAISSGDTVRDRYHQPVRGAHVLCNAGPVMSDDSVIGAITAEREITDKMRLTHELARSNTQVSNLQREIAKINRPADAFHRIIGQSPALLDVVSMAKKVAPTDVSILLRGESGTGKELFAEAVHKASQRHDKPFVVINCAAIPPTLLESELFGYEPGSFTGADKRGRKGKFDQADGGTLFLDEIGEMPPDMQVKLLRVLQNQRFYRVGGSEAVNVDVRLISATNRDLDKLISEGLFRDDLYYRINVVSLEIPPLRERREDIPQLVQVFAREFCMKQGITVKRVDQQALNVLLSYPWPGNVRELRNVIERVVVLCEGGNITVDQLPGLVKYNETVTEERFSGSLTDVRGKTEREMILSALDKAHGDRSKAAQLLGVPRSTLYYKLNKYQIIEKKQSVQKTD